MEQEILDAFLARLALFSTSPAVPVSWPDVSFEPPDEGFWLEAAFFPGAVINLAMDDYSLNDVRGFCQVKVCYTADAGQLAPYALVQEVINWFPKGTELGPVKVNSRPSPLPVVREDKARRFIAITIPYQGICRDAA